MDKLFKCKECGTQHPIGPAELKFICICGYITLFPEHIWQGPGIYKHYKGGIYIAFGKGKLEYNNRIHVSYMTLDVEEQRRDWYDGLFCVFRPFNEADGPDSWNSFVLPPDREPEFSGLLVSNNDVKQVIVPRFKKVAA